ncbi:MAG: hypothetical protein AB7E55_07720 [Pigmentiphaga sp.]
MIDVRRFNFTVSKFETISPYASEHGQYVRYDDYAKLEAEAQALRDQVKALQSDANSYQSGYDEGRRMGTKHRQSEVEQLTREVASLRARVVVVPDWKPLTGPGQIKKGDLLRFAVAGKEIEAPAQLIINEGTGKEEIVYNRGKNHYFITSMAVDGTSSHKGVMVRRLNGKVVSEGLLLRIEQECRINHDWNCQNVPAGTRSATTRARKMLEIADELRSILQR